MIDFLHFFQITSFALGADESYLPADFGYLHKTPASLSPQAAAYLARVGICFQPI
jgi:hypothetical protein